MQRYKQQTSGSVGPIDAGIVGGATATGAIASGELAVLHESGIIRRANPELPWSAITNNTAGAIQITAASVVATADGTAPASLAALPNSDVFGFTGGLAGGGFFGVRNVSGARGPLFANPLGVNAILTKIVALSTGQFAVFGYITATGPNTTIYYRIFNADGTAATSIQTIDTWAGNINVYDVAALDNGLFVVAYGNNSGNVSAKVFTSTGTQNGSTVVGPAGVASLFVIACANGDFVLLTNIDNTTAPKIARYTHAAVSVFASTTANNGVVNSYDARGGVELDSGVIAILGMDADTTHFAVYLHNGSTGAFISATTTVYDKASQASFRSIPGGCYVVGCIAGSTTHIGLTTFDQTGRSMTGPADVVTDAGSPTKISTTYTGATLAIARFGGAELKMIVCDLNGTVLGSDTNVAGNTDQEIAGSLTHRLDGLVSLVWFDNTAGFLKFASYQCARCSPIGVAQNDAVDKGSLSLASQGAFALPASQVFPFSGTFDCRSNAVPGVAGTVGSGFAWLKGWK